MVEELLETRVKLLPSRRISPVLALGAPMNCDCAFEFWGKWSDTGYVRRFYQPATTIMMASFSPCHCTSQFAVVHMFAGVCRVLHPEVHLVEVQVLDVPTKGPLSLHHFWSARQDWPLKKFKMGLRLYTTWARKAMLIET